MVTRSLMLMDYIVEKMNMKLESLPQGGKREMKKLIVLLVAGLFVFGSTIANAESCGFLGCDMPGHSKSIKYGMVGHVPAVTTSEEVPAVVAPAPVASADPLAYENLNQVLENIQVRDDEDLSLAAQRIKDAYVHFRDEAVERAYELETTAGALQRSINEYLQWRDGVSHSRPKTMPYTVRHGDKKEEIKLNITHGFSDIPVLKTQVAIGLPNLINDRVKNIKGFINARDGLIKGYTQAKTDTIERLNHEIAGIDEQDLANRRRIAEINSQLARVSAGRAKITASERAELAIEVQKRLTTDRAALALRKKESVEGIAAAEKEYNSLTADMTAETTRLTAAERKEAVRLHGELTQLSREVKVLEGEEGKYKATIKRIYSGDENRAGFYKKMEDAQRSFLMLSAVGTHMEAQRENEVVVRSGKIDEFSLPISVTLTHEFDRLVDKNGRFTSQYTLKNITDDLSVNSGVSVIKTSSDAQGILRDMNLVPEIFDLESIRSSQVALWTPAEGQFHNVCSHQLHKFKEFKDLNLEGTFCPEDGSSVVSIKQDSAIVPEPAVVVEETPAVEADETLLGATKDAEAPECHSDVPAIDGTIIHVTGDAVEAVAEKLKEKAPIRVVNDGFLETPVHHKASSQVDRAVDSINRAVKDAKKKSAEERDEAIEKINKVMDELPKVMDAMEKASENMKDSLNNEGGKKIETPLPYVVPGAESSQTQLNEEQVKEFFRTHIYIHGSGYIPVPQQPVRGHASSEEMRAYGQKKKAEKEARDAETMGTIIEKMSKGKLGRI